MADADSRIIIIEGWIKKNKVKVKAARIAMAWEVEEYKKSKDFEDEVAKGYLESLHLRFFECKKVARTFLKLDLRAMVEFDDESEEEANRRVA